MQSFYNLQVLLETLGPQEQEGTSVFQDLMGQ